jgi:Spy/CpxP family protein refolding chaperone
MWPGGPGLSRLLDTVQATPEQRSQVEAIAQAAQADLRTRHEASAQLRQQTMALFMKPTVDTAAAEALRQQMLVQHDQATQRMLQAMVDVSRVLTAEQRQQLAQRMQAREERGGHRHGDRGPGRS